MKTLSFREKSLVSLVGVAVAAALVSIWVPADGKSTAAQADKKAADLNEFATQLALKVAQNGISAFEAAAIEKASEAWETDPFATLQNQSSLIESSPVKADAGEPGGAKLSWSGYLKMGRRQLAVINGVEYEAGDRLSDLPGLVVQSISSDKVLLIQVNTGAKIILTIEEESPSN